MDPKTCFGYFSYCHFHNDSKECLQPKKEKKNSNLLHRFKSVTLKKFEICQNGTFDLFEFFDQKHYFKAL